MPIPLAGGLPSSVRAVRRRWPSSSRVVPPVIDGVQQTELKAVVQEFPAKVGLDLANWNWKVVRRFVQERFEVSLRACLQSF